MLARHTVAPRDTYSDCRYGHRGTGAVYSQCRICDFNWSLPATFTSRDQEKGNCQLGLGLRFRLGGLGVAVDVTVTVTVTVTVMVRSCTVTKRKANAIK